MSKSNHNLIIVAHPDDETLFFAGLMLMNKKTKWHVVCVTDGNADGMGLKRAQDFTNATRALGVQYVEQWNLPDRFEKRLSLSAMAERLSQLPIPKKVFTHGPLGEYSHPHHQDVSFAVHQYFQKKCPIYSVAYNLAPDLVVNLSTQAYQKKCKILSEIYFSETERFIQILPATFAEGFSKLSFSEVNECYTALTQHLEPNIKKLKKLKWMAPYMGSLTTVSKKRMF